MFNVDLEGNVKWELNGRSLLFATIVNGSIDEKNILLKQWFKGLLQTRFQSITI